MYGTATARAKSAAIEPRSLSAAEAGLQRVIEQLMPRLRMAVIFGGNKANADSVVYQSQNTRSWKSYEAVAEDIGASLRRVGFRHVEVIPEDMHLGDRLRRSGAHMAWLNSGGVQGHNSTAHAPATLEMLGMPYVGHDPLNATTLDNKHAFKREAVCAGLPTAAFSTWDMARGPFRPELNSRFNIAFGDYTGPFIVKPVSGRASLHVHVVPDIKSLPDVVAEVHRETNNIILIEKYLSGREFCIAVAGKTTARDGVITRGNEPFAFGALERTFQADEKIFTSMDFRPITGNRFKSVDPRESKVWTNLHQIAREVYMEFNLGTLIRIDLRADADGKLFILEANPKPDLKYPAAGVTSLVSAGLAQTDLGYDDLMLSLLADRLDYFLHQRIDTVQHIADLLDPGATDFLKRDLNSSDTDVIVRSLGKTAQRMRS